MGWSITPSRISDHEMIENWLSKIHQKAMADSTVGTTQGSRMTARKKFLNGRCRFSSSASHRPSANFAIEAKTV